MNLVQRVQDILLRPRETWPQVEAESTDTATLYKGYLMLLAAIGPVCSFIGLSVLGLGFGFRLPVMAGLSMAIVHYVLTLVWAYGMALNVDALAPTFGGPRGSPGRAQLERTPARPRSCACPGTGRSRD